MLNRQYVSTLALLVTWLVALIAVVIAFYSPSLALFASEATGMWLTAILAVALACYITYGWGWGFKTAEPVE